jgi:PAS domain S-box-containing protein
VAIPIVVLLHQFGLAGPAPLWVLVEILLISALAETPPVARRLLPTGPGDTRRMHLSIAIDTAQVTTICYLCGWGPVLGAGYVAVAAVCLRLVGAVAARPAICWAAAGIATGQLAVGLGWCYSYIPPLQSQAAGLLGGAAVIMTIRGMGMMTEQREREAADRTHAEEALRRNEERFRALVQDSSTMIMVSDASGALTYVSPAVEHLLGYHPETFATGRLSQIIHPDDLTARTADWRTLVDGGDEVHVEARVRHADGTWRWHEITVRNLLTNPAVRGVVSHHRDITERKEYQEQLAYDATHDALTGLANRAAFLRALADACAEPVSGAEPGNGRGQTAVLYLDLDGFKQINDDLGHEAGDTLLRAVATVLRDAVRDCDTVGRIGGDEFCVAISEPGRRTAPHDPQGARGPNGSSGSHRPHLGGASDVAVTVAERVIERLRNPVPIGAVEVRIRASIGIAVTDSLTVDADELLRRADVAMYQAKRSVNSGWRRYSEPDPDRQETSSHR